MSWEKSLIRIAGYDVEIRQKRLAEVVLRREAAEMRLLMIDAEQEAEAAFIRSRPEAAFHQSAYLAGCKARRLNILAEIDLILAEESGARDALAEASSPRRNTSMWPTAWPGAGSARPPAVRPQSWTNWAFARRVARLPAASDPQPPACAPRSGSFALRRAWMSSLRRKRAT